MERRPIGDDYFRERFVTAVRQQKAREQSDSSGRSKHDGYAKTLRRRTPCSNVRSDRRDMSVIVRDVDVRPTIGITVVSMVDFGGFCAMKIITIVCVRCSAQFRQ